MPDTLQSRIEPLLPRVQKPGRYIGHEVNAIPPQPEGDTDRRFVIAFGDIYDIGMSCEGLQIVYHLVNDTVDGWRAERAFLPWPDMIDELRANDLPLYSLESVRSLRECDVLAFTLQYEMGYTGALEMLDLAGIPLRSADRTNDDPIVIAGGPGAATPEPMAPFIDVFVPGDAEATLPGVLRALDASADRPRDERLLDLARAREHVYVPSLYECRYGDDGTLLEIAAREVGLPPRIVSGFVQSLDEAPYPTRPVVPYVDTVHDRYSIEIMRGCPNVCRFCQAMNVKSPLRLRSVDRIVELAEAGYAGTGHSEISLLGLSVGDYPHMAELLPRLRKIFDPLKVNISVPSLRVEKVLRELPSEIASVRKSGLTIAPEAARQAMRERIGKRITDENLFSGIDAAFGAGWDTVKLYFMIGLPGETDEDVDAIVELSGRVARRRKELGVKGGPAKVNVSVANFIPKPHTAFEREPMADADYLNNAQRRIMDRNRPKSVKISRHHVTRSRIEALLCRGDRRVADVIEGAWRRGSRLDSWDDFFDVTRWDEAMAESGVDIAFYISRPYSEDEVLPWSIVEIPRGMRR